jgi:hypothetical protein
MATISSRVQVGANTLSEQALVAKGAYRVFVTPEIASQWLTYRRPHQRAINRANVMRLVRIMREGSWRHDYPGGVIFSANLDGRPSLDDGQHTLHAIIEDGNGQWLNVTTGASPDLFKYLGGDKARTTAHRFREMDIDSDNAKFHSAIRAARYARTSRAYPMAPGVTEVWCSAYREHVKAAMQLNERKRGSGRAGVVAVLAEYHSFAPDKAKVFGMSISEPDGPSQPGRMLRDFLLCMPPSMSGWGAVTRVYGAAVAAAVADYEGRTIQIVRPRSGWPDHLLAMMPEEIQTCTEYPE